MSIGGVLIDPTPAILAELRASPELAAALALAAPIADKRVWAEKVPRDADMSPIVTSMYAPMVGILSAGGFAYERALINQPRFELRAYAITSAGARILCYAAMNALNERAIRREGVICYASFAPDMGGSSPYPNIDPPTETPYFYCFFGVTTYSENRA